MGDIHFNNKEVKNIRFLPFLRERNGLGKIIESVRAYIFIFILGLRNTFEKQKSTNYNGNKQNISTKKEVK